MKSKGAIIRTAIGAVLLMLALFWTCLAMMARADWPGDVSRGKTAAWIIVGPLWAGFTFIASSALLRGKRNKIVISAVLSVVVWVAVGVTLNWWEDEKMRIRNAPMEDLRGERNEAQGLEQSPRAYPEERADAPSGSGQE